MKKIIYRQEAVELSPSEFEALMQALQAKLEKDWEHSPELLPSYNIKSGHRSRRVFFGTKDHISLEESQNSSLYDYMILNDEVRNCMDWAVKNNIKKNKGINKRYIEDRYNDYARPEEKIILSKLPYNYIYFLYAGYKSYEDFKQSKWCENLCEEKEESIKIAQTISTEETKWTEYYLCGLRISENKIIKHEIHINLNADKSSMDVIVYHEEGGISHGIARYEYPYLEIRTDRKNNTSNYWMPFTLYFKVDDYLTTFSIITGTHSGVAFKSKEAIAGVSVLIRKNIYELNEKKVAQFLFLSPFGTEVYVPLKNLASEKDNLKLLNSKSSIATLTKLEGTHELYDFSIKKDKKLTVYLLNIDERLSAKLISPNDEEFKYVVQLSKIGGTLLLDVSAVKETQGYEYLSKSTSDVIDINNPFDVIEGVKLYRGYTCGINRSGEIIAYPYIFVLNPPNPTKGIYIKDEINSVLFKQEGREKLNQRIIELLYKLENDRVIKLKKLFGNLPIGTKNLNP